MTRSLESVKIHQFRGLRDLELNNLGLINVLVGINNSGKTSVLEALQIYCHPLDIRVWISTSRQREQETISGRTPPIDSLRWLFSHEFNPDPKQPSRGNILISSEGSFPVRTMRTSYEQIEGFWISDRSDKESFLDEQQPMEIEEASEVRKGIELNIDLYALQLNSLEDVPSQSESFRLWEGDFLRRVNRKIEPSLLTTTVTPSSHRSEVGQIQLLSEAHFQNFKNDVLNLLQQLDKNISDLEILVSPNTAVPRVRIYIQHEKLGLTPISTFGDGVRRLLHIALKLASVRGGVLFIDELESAIHTEALQNCFSWLTKWCKDLDVQLFATTHSLEAVDALLEVTESSSDLVLYRLEPKEEQTRVVRHDWNRLKRLREEFGQEVRW